MLGTGNLCKQSTALSILFLIIVKSGWVFFVCLGSFSKLFINFVLKLILKFIYGFSVYIFPSDSS